MPRKSTASTAEGEDAATTAGDVPKGQGKSADVETGANVEDYLLPRSLTQRLAKGVLPPNTSIHKDALLAISKAATVFVSYLSSHANEETQKKTITPQDVLAALSEIEFDSFRPRLEKELQVYNEAAERKRRAKKDGQGQDAAGGPATEKLKSASTADSEREAKRVKRSSGHEFQVAVGRSKDANGGPVTDPRPATAVEDDDTTDELDDDEHGDEDRDGEEEEEDGDGGEQDDNDEEDDEQEDGSTQLDNELDTHDSDSAMRRRNPDLDSDLESDSDAI